MMMADSKLNEKTPWPQGAFSWADKARDSTAEEYTRKGTRAVYL